MRVIKKNYNLKGSVNSNIVLISDLHYSSKNELKILNKILKKIENIKPDFICIPGDFTDEAYICDEMNFIDWLVKLSKISKVIISLGNHEFYKNKRKKEFGLNENLINKIKEIKNIYLLDNENILIDDINFIGVTLPVEYYLSEESGADIKKYLYKFKTYNSHYNILLCHSPINICKSDVLKNSGVDLLFCGHMHGGVTPRFLRCILKNSGLISPARKMLPKICYGYLKVYNTDVIITSGVTILSHINKYRYFNNLFASEVAHITIKK